jgi:hypothetical protein
LPFQILKDIHLNIFPLFTIADIMLFSNGFPETTDLANFLVAEFNNFPKEAPDHLINYHLITL